MAELQPPLSPPPVFQTLPPVANFWTRFFALVIDIALLTFIFFFVARIGYKTLYPIRWSCDFLAFLLVFGYFTICSSRLTGGQTLGKRLLGVRVISLTGAALTWQQALIRGALIQLLILAYLFLPRFFGFLGYGRLTQFLFFIPSIMLPGISVPSILIPVVMGYLGLAYALANAVFCGLGPKKLSFHDVLAHTAVARVGDEQWAREFAEQWDDMDRAKRKASLWPSIIIAAVVLFVFVLTMIKAIPQFQKEFAPIRAAKDALDIPGFRFAGVMGPSEEGHLLYLENIKRYQEAVEQAKKNPNPRSRPLPVLTTETLQYAQTGEKFLFSFECDEDFTSQSLINDLRYQKLVRRLPGLTRDLSRQFFRNKAGEPARYIEIQIGFIEVLPLYLYSSVQGVWQVVFPKDTPPAPPLGTQARDEQRNETPDHPERNP